MSSTTIRKWMAAAAVAAAFAVAIGSAAAAAAPARHNSSPGSFVSAADGNCAALGKLLAPLGNPTTLPGIAHKLTVAVPAFTMALRAQAELTAPAGDERVFRHWMAAMTSYRNTMETIRAAAVTGKSAVVGKANSQLTAIGARSAALSKQLGLHVCFQSG